MYGAKERLALVKCYNLSVNLQAMTNFTQYMSVTWSLRNVCYQHPGETSTEPLQLAVLGYTESTACTAIWSVQRHGCSSLGCQRKPYLVSMNGLLPVIFSKAECVATASDRPYKL